MKKLNLFSVVIVSFALLASGCHRKPGPLTPIPGGDVPANQNANRDQNLNTQGTPVPSDNQPRSREGNIPQDPIGLLTGPHNEDRETFKADTVYFDFDRATIKASEESKLQDVYNHFKSSTGDALNVEGNCDERGTEKYNLSLGERRALAIREYLVNLGMDARRIGTVTYGASRPAEPGHNEEAWKKNRRGDLVLITPK